MALEFEKYVLKQKYFGDDYTEMLKGLFPVGPIWRWGRAFLDGYVQDTDVGDTVQDTDTGDTVQDTDQGINNSGHLLTRMLSAFALELSRLEEFAWDVLKQSDPRVATDLLEDWERVQALSTTDSTGAALTLEERQRAAGAKLFSSPQTATESYYIDYAAALGFVITIVQNPVNTLPRIMGVAIMGDSVMSNRGGYSILEITVVSGTGNLNQLKTEFNSIKPAHVVITWS